MSAKTKIVVLHMKELIYTAIFVGLGILLIMLLLFMFLPKKEKDKSVETMKYVAGVYTSSILFHDSTLDVQVIVDENRINSISLVNLNETVNDNVSVGGACVRRSVRPDHQNTVGGKYILSGRQSIHNGYAFKCGGECA